MQMLIKLVLTLMKICMIFVPRLFQAQDVSMLYVVDARQKRWLLEGRLQGKEAEGR